MTRSVPRASVSTAARWTPIAVFAIGFGFSLAANLLWTWSGGPVRILGGALASIALPAAVHMWPAVSSDTATARALRNVVMTAIALLAAVTTFVHAASLLVSHGEIPWLAYAYPTITELLVVFAVLAHHGLLAAAVDAAAEQARNAATVATPPRKRAPAVRRTPTAASAPAAPLDQVAGYRATQDARVAWLREQPETTWSLAVESVMTEFKVSKSTAKRVVATHRDLGGMAS